ncbi:pentapeptide repeat-containing protein [Enterococcus sp. DIV1297f]|uniref:pentapeptide repeat-containing protein n=1 Tax=Enterococcus sp. DIV1297f TaxID=2774691 RepID=UPI003D2D9FDE
MKARTKVIIGAISLLVFIGMLVVSINYSSISEKISSFFIGWGLYGEDTFWKDLILSFNQAILEVVLFSVVIGSLLKYFENRTIENNKLEKYLRNLRLSKNLDGEEVRMHKSMWLSGIFEISCSNLDLKHMEFMHTNISNQNLTRIDFSGTNFNSSQITNTTFQDCDFSGASFNNAVLKKVKFTDCKMHRVYQKKVQALGVDFSNCDLKKAHFNSSELRSSIFKGANLEEVDFKNANLAHSNFIDIEPKNLKILEPAGNLNRIKIEKTLYKDLENRFPEKFKHN